MSDKRRGPWLIWVTAPEQPVMGGRQDRHAWLCRLGTVPCSSCTLIMTAFQQMAVKCLVPSPNLHKVLLGPARVLESAPMLQPGVSWPDAGQLGVERANRNPVPKS